MRFTCDACSAKYSIADERVKGRILKIRCKACNHIITVREEEKSRSGRLPLPPNEPVPPNRKVPVGEAIDAAFGPAVAPDESEHTVVSHNPGLLLDLQKGAPPPVPAAVAVVEEWFVSFDGEQEGPLSVARAKERIGNEHPKGRECFAWKAGFFVWLPVEEIPELRDAAAGKSAKGGNGKGAAAAVAAAANPVSTATSQKTVLSGEAPVIPVAARNGHTAGNGAGQGDLLITEASALINLDHLRAAAMAKPAAGSGPAVGPTASLDPASPDAAPTPAPVVVVAGPAPRRASSAIKWVAAMGVLLTVGFGGSLAYVLVQNSRAGDGSPHYQPEPTKKADDRPISFIDGTPTPTTMGVDPKAVASKKVGTAPVGTKTTPTPTGTKTAGGNLNASQKNLASLYAEEGDTTAPKALPNVGHKESSGGQVNQAAILQVVTQNKRSLNMCYERVLKRDSTLKRARVVTQVKVGMSGMVTKVTVPDPQYADSEIGQCLTQAIKKWRFPSSEGEYETEFPILLQAE